MSETPNRPSLNADLLRKTLDAVEHADGHWRQDDWRDLSGDTWRITEPQIARSGQYGLSAADAECGTTMCFAGWAVQLSPRAVYLVDAEAVVAARRADDLDLAYALTALAERVLVRPTAMDGMGCGYEALDEWLDRRLRCLDLTAQACALLRLTHADRLDWTVTLVQDAALRVLGIGSDPLGLFEGDKNADSVQATVEAYLSGEWRKARGRVRRPE